MHEPGPDWVLSEFHVWPSVHSGYVRCPNGFRLLDTLNYVGAARPEAEGQFFEFIDAAETDAALAQKASEYVRKAVVDMVAVAKANAARGVGARVGVRAYPYRQKSPVAVNITLPHHTLIGMAHCFGGQGIRHVLNLPCTFFPLTDVTIAHEYGLYGSRPFVAVNKEHIISLRVEVLAERR